MERLTVTELQEIAENRADQFIRGIRDSNKSESVMPLVEIESMRAFFVQMVAQRLMETCEIVRSRSPQRFKVPPVQRVPYPPALFVISPSTPSTPSLRLY